MFEDSIAHHAYLIEGNREGILGELFAAIEKHFGIVREANPDFSYDEFDSFSIDDGRRLKEMQSKRAFSDTKKIFVMTMNSMTHEAQNSLLKVFEEPTADTHFFIVLPSVQSILPTLRSRVIVISHASRSEGISLDEAGLFIKATPKERLEMIKSLIDEDDKGAMRAEARELLESVLMVKRATLDMRKSGAKDVSALENILRGLSYLSDRSSSPKLILEQIALTL